MTTRLNGEVLFPKSVVEIAGVPPQFRVHDDGNGITFEDPDDKLYQPEEHHAGIGSGTITLRVTLPDGAPGTIEIDSTQSHYFVDSV